MTLHPLLGHVTEQDRVIRALKEGRLPQGLLITGPAGVGKQRFGLWLGQAILCEAETRPCGTCQSCRQVLGLAHPDLHWMVPVPRPKASEPDKQVEELAETLGQVMEERRRNPVYEAPDGLAGHFVATARLLQRRAALTPAQGRRKVFLLAVAERLVPQESSPEAANALLKLLEEPPADSHFLLTTEDANRLLPTIRSRLVPLRLGRLADADVERFLGTHAGLAGTELRERVQRGRGSIGRALAAGEAGQKAGRAAEELLQLVVAGPGARAERALKQGPFAARGDFTAMLDALAEQLSRLARGADGGGSAHEGPRRRPGLDALVEAQARVAEARDAAQGNVNPQLLLVTLTEDLAEVLA
ncbi:MAG: DNA polymerase III subunit [Gemmatimonadetes bacterium]|nr:DNA polymerase III subunit [Gemmatimonadota bacterium]